MTERFDALTEPPVAGQYYLVLCVRGTWDGKRDRWWPIWGPLHEDTKWINFTLPHWHLNRFFVSDNDQYRATGMPFHGGSVRDNEPLPTPILRRIKCRRSLALPFPTYKAPSLFAAMQTHFAGQQCKRGAGWICPHKGFDLGPIAPQDDGTIACPLHGIRIHAQTGVVLPYQ